MPDAAERGIADLLFHAVMDENEPFCVERFRGAAPDRVLAEVYNVMRNFGGPHCGRIRQLAGFTDENGSPLTGYVLASNGCILDDKT